MADLLLRKSGRVICIDDQDLQWAETWVWRTWNNPLPGLKRAVMVVRDERIEDRVYRVMLHREIASRMFPKAAPSSLRVKCLNGDYTDCRRDNISIILVNTKSPRGFKLSRKTKQRYRNVRQASALWASGKRAIRSSVNRAD